MLTIGFIGAGGIAYWHATKMLVFPEKFNLKAVCDINEEAVKFYKEKFNFQDGYTDYHELLKDSSIDAVIISLPHYLHEESCIAAFKAGKHVFVDKPIACTVKEAQNIIEASERAGKTLMIGCDERYTDEAATIKQNLEKNVIGEVFSARIDHFQNFRKDPSHWWYQKDKVGGGCVIGSGVHRLDLLRWFFGEAEEVFAYQQYMPERLEAEVNCNALIKFKNGMSADFTCNWGIYNYLYYEGISIFGKEGAMNWNVHSNPFTIGLSSVENGALLPAEKIKSVNMYEHFYDCILNGKTPLSSGEEGLKTLELIMAIYQSADTGKIVKLNK